MTKILCHVSGGYDSVAAAIKLLEAGYDVTGLFFNINQPYLSQETQACNKFDSFATRKYNNWKGMLYKTIPMELQRSNDGSPSEYIPVRNFVFAAHSANIALAEGFSAVAVGSKTTYIRAGDPYSFRDCSVEFYDKLNDIVAYASEDGDDMQFIMPLITKTPGWDWAPLTKGQVVKIILDSGMDITELWTCYKTGIRPCGECYHCKEAKKAFDEIGESYEGIFQK